MKIFLLLTSLFLISACTSQQKQEPQDINSVDISGQTIIELSGSNIQTIR